jgi:hypothetical protein
MKIALSLLVVLLAFGVAAAATDLTGAWSLELAPDFSGHNDTIACSFAQTVLTANCAPDQYSGEAGTEGHVPRPLDVQMSSRRSRQT